MKTTQNAAPDSGTVVQVRALRYDLVKLRLGQALLPVALVAFPIARRFGSLPVRRADRRLLRVVVAVRGGPHPR